MMFSAWDYGHYSMLHAEEEASYCGRFAQLLETGSLGASTAGKLSAGNVCKEKAAHKVHFSSLSRQEHKLYLRLLSKYRERVITEPTPIQQQEIAQLADLQRRVVEEQKLFSLAFCQLPEARACYASIQPDALRFAREHASRRLERLLRLPRYFVAHQKVALECPPEDQVLPHFHRNLIMRGKCPRLVRPSLNHNCFVNLEHQRLTKRFPAQRSTHPSFGVSLTPSLLDTCHCYWHNVASLQEFAFEGFRGILTGWVFYAFP